MTSQIVQDVVQTVAQDAPNSPVVQVAEAVMQTAASPANPLNIINDIELAVSLVKHLKTVLNNSHPSLTDLIKALL